MPSAAYLQRLGIAVACCLLAQSAPSMAQNKKELAIVINSPGAFWDLCKKGMEKAQTELPNYRLQMYTPAETSAAAQKRMVEDLMAKGGVAGVAISPVSPAESKSWLNAVASKAVLFTMDADAPDSDRIMYIGTDNVAAGRQAGEEMKRALPNGGKAMLFVGTMDAANARERVQGIKEVLAGSNIQIVDIRTDDADRAKAKANVEDTLIKYPDVKLMVGVWAYNGPVAYSAIKEAGKLGEVKVVGFDDDSTLLRAIADKGADATIVQQSYKFCRQAMLDMAKYIEGDKSVVPANKVDFASTAVVDKSNVADYQKNLKLLLGK